MTMRRLPWKERTLKSCRSIDCPRRLRTIFGILLSDGIPAQRTRLVSRSFALRIASAPTLQRAAVEVVFKTIGDLSEWRAVLCMKRYIGCAGLTSESFYRKPRLRNCV